MNVLDQKSVISPHEDNKDIPKLEQPEKSKTVFDSLREIYPHMRPLDTEFYTAEPYRSSKYRRCKIMVLLGSMLQCPEFRSLDTKRQNEMVIHVEKSCLNHSIKKATGDNINRTWSNPLFQNRYSASIADMAEALNWDSNPWIMPRVVRGLIKTQDLGGMSPQELCPNRDALLRRVEERKHATISMKTTTLYPCPNCEKKEAYFQEVQLRSGDEAKDTQLSCVFCGHEWVERG